MRLEAMELTAPIAGVLITHEHSDHIGAARILERALHRKQGALVPFFMTAGTARNLPPNCRPSHIVEIEADRPFRLEDWIIEPLSIPHDTADPVAYTVQAGSTRVGVLTDLGHVTSSVRSQFGTLDVAVLEFNHDLDLLLSGAYPTHLKDRVRGPYGHLSNAQASELVRHSASSRLRHIVLAHLSADNNTIDRAYLACNAALIDAGFGKTKIHIATQSGALAPIRHAPPSSVMSPQRIPNRPHPHPKLPPQNQPSLFPDL